MIDVKEGDVLEWNAVNGPTRGYVICEDGETYVFLEDGHSFFLRDLLRTPSLKVVGKVRVK